MSPLAAERKALLFSVGDVRLALRLSQVREIVAAAGEGGDVVARGAAVPALPLGVVLGIPAASTGARTGAGGLPGVALLVEADSPLALRVDAVHGIVDLARAEAFQLPARTRLPEPSPFQGVLAVDGALALELAVSALGWAPLEPAADPPGPPPELDLAPGRELLFARGGRVFAVPLALLVQVLEAPRLHAVPLAPPSHLGLAYHGRAIHPVLDAPVLHGDPPGPPAAANVLLVDAGGAQVGLAADRILQPGAAPSAPVSRPSWDALFAG